MKGIFKYEHTFMKGILLCLYIYMGSDIYIYKHTLYIDEKIYTQIPTDLHYFRKMPLSSTI